MHKTNRTARYLAVFTMLVLALSMVIARGGTQQVARAQGGTAAATAAPTITPTPLASTEGTLTIWADELRAPVMEKLGKDFEAKYNVPIRIQQLAFGDIRDQMKVAGPAGQGPDILIGANDWLGDLVTNGLLSEMDLGDKTKSIDPVALNGFSYQGKLYGLPYDVEAVALFYNKDLVPTPPGTWDDLKSLAKKLQDDKKVDQGYVLQEGDPYHTYPLITGFGGYVFGKNQDGSYNPQDLGLDSPGSLAAAKEIDSMVKDGLLRANVNYDTMMNLFKTGKSAMMITGPWALADIRKSGIKYGVAKLPKMVQNPRPFVGIHGFMVSKFSKNELLAKTFLTEYVATDDTMMAMFQADPRGPAWLPIRDKINDPDQAVFAQSASDGDPLPAIPQMNAVWDAWGKAITLIFQQKADPEQAFKDAAKAIRDQIAAAK